MIYQEYLSTAERRAYEQARVTVEMMEELMILRAENDNLKQKLAEKNSFIDGLYQNSIGQVSNALSIMIDKE